jgi:hypothetical protein
MSKPARSDEPKVNQFQMKSKAQITKFEQKIVLTLNLSSGSLLCLMGNIRGTVLIIIKKNLMLKKLQTSHHT